MFKKGDLVKGLLSGAVYKCLDDFDPRTDSVNVECIIASPEPGNTKIIVGYKANLLIGNLALFIPLMNATPAVQEKIETESLVDLRRSLKKFLVG